MNKGVIFGIIFLFLFSSQVFAIDPIETEVNAIKDTILPDESAEFYFKIRNNQDFQDSFRILKPVVYWDWNLDSDIVTINQAGFESVQLFFEPFSDKEPGDYGILLTVQSISNETIETSQLFEIHVVSYDQAISVEFDSSENINPNKENLFRVNITWGFIYHI